MKNRLFDIINGEPVVTAPLLNLKAFRNLWNLDKTDDKSIYKKWLLYIYYMYDYKSEFHDQKDKQEKVLKEVFNTKHVKIPHKKLDPCIKEYIEKNTCAEQRTLEAAIASADSVTENITKFQQESRQTEEVINLLEVEIKNCVKAKETLLAVELTKQKLELQEKQLEIIKKSSDLIPRIQKGIESIVLLREVVDNALLKKQSDGDTLEDYIIDSFLDKKIAGKYTLD
jgi:hypothetical protein